MTTQPDESGKPYAELDAELERELTPEEVSNRLLAAKNRSSEQILTPREKHKPAQMRKLVDHAHSLIGETGPARGAFFLSILSAELAAVSVRMMRHLFETRGDLCGEFSPVDIAHIVHDSAAAAAAAAGDEHAKLLMDYVQPRFTQLLDEVYAGDDHADGFSAEKEIDLPLLQTQIKAGDVVCVIGKSYPVACTMSHWCRSLSRRQIGYNRFAMSAMAALDPLSSIVAMITWWNKPKERLVELLKGMPGCLPLFIDDAAGLSVKPYQLAAATGRAVIVGYRTDTHPYKRVGEHDIEVMVELPDSSDNDTTVLVNGKYMFQDGSGEIVCEG